MKLGGKDHSKSIFRAYDVRGIYGESIDESDAERIGKALASVYGSGKQIGVARDIRLSSNSLHDALVNGLLFGGSNVVDFGEIPTPLLYFGTWYRGLTSGTMITASHLPPEWNGFKFSGNDGITLSEGTGLEEIREAFARGNFKHIEGSSHMTNGVVDDYIDYVSKKIHIKRPVKVVFDFGNSVTSAVVPKLMQRFDVNASWINETIDGRFPNRASEPSESSLQGLKARVLSEEADIGIGYDSDGDRVAFVDERGEIFASGDVTIPLLAQSALHDNLGGKIVYDITCSSAVGDYIRKLGGEPVIVRVGHSYCAKEVLKQKALFGGQYSGHLAFPEVNCADDAIFGSLKLLEILASSGKKLSELVGKIPKYFTSGMKEIACGDTLKFAVISKIAKKARRLDYKLTTLDGVLLSDEQGRVLIRASNTSPIIRINSDGKSKGVCDAFQELGEKLVLEEINNNG